jgi:GT2 family glycosyltransferase/glycosyltransferase involved in cell wall biosynthesis
MDAEELAARRRESATRAVDGLWREAQSLPSDSLSARVDLAPCRLPPGHAFPALEPVPGRVGDKGRICFISTELVGARFNGGIGTAQTNLAKTLAAGGHQVTIFYFRKPDRPLTDPLKAYYAGLGIEIVQNEDFETDFYGRGRIRYPYGTYEWLRTQSFDVVHAPELHAYLYYALLAKRLGLAFANTTFVIGTHCSSEWLAELNHTSLSDKDQLIAPFMERAGVAMADVVWSPSHYLLDWMREANWPLGDNCWFRRLPYLPYDGLEPATAAGEPITELVFFGRLQKRKGVELFCDAIDRLQPLIRSLGRPFKVTFLGDNFLAQTGLPADLHVRRAAAWGHEVLLIEDYDVPRALAYLSQPGRLAVVPSLADNSPNTIHECLLYNVPFAASNVGGIPELVAESDRDRVLFAPRAADCARVLGALLQAPARPVTPSFDGTEVNRGWVEWHDQAVAAARAAQPAAPKQKLPSITVCISHFNRTRLLRQALAGLDRQTYRDFDVVVADDGSTDPAEIQALAELEPWLAERGWALVRQANAYLGAVRNRAALAAKGDYLFFLDDDDVLVPSALETLARAAAHSGADLLDPVYMSFVSEEEPGASTEIPSRFIALGGGLALSSVWNTNTFGGAAFLVRRKAFLDLGGFTTDYGIGHEDWEFLIRAELAGLDLYLLPDSLVWVRKSAQGMQATGDRFLDNRRTLRPLLQRAAPYQRLMLLHAQDVERERDQYRDAAYAIAWERDQLKGRLQAVEKSLETAQQINSMLLDKMAENMKILPTEK